MGIIEIILLAIGLSMDAFAVAICKGLAMEKVSIKKVAIVGAWFGGFQALMPLIGFLLGVSFKDYIVAIGIAKCLQKIMPNVYSVLVGGR